MRWQFQSSASRSLAPAPMAGQTKLTSCGAHSLDFAEEQFLVWDGRAVGGCAFFDPCGLPAFEDLRCLGDLSTGETNQEE